MDVKLSLISSNAAWKWKRNSYYIVYFSELNRRKFNDNLQCKRMSTVHNFIPLIYIKFI